MANWKFSIIVMTYNESRQVNRLVQLLLPLVGSTEIIIVDGQSDDGTYELLERRLATQLRPIVLPSSAEEVLHPTHPLDCGFRLIQTEKSRGWQQNVGAILSHGNALLFLHADVQLPPRALSEMTSVLDRNPYGCFGIRFPLINPLMITNRIFSNLRAKSGVVFGDQGLFITRELFFAMGMMPDQTFMEDYQFSLNLKSAGLRPRFTRHRITASPRAYPQDIGGTWERMKLIFALRDAYRKGADVAELARRYGDRR